MPNNTYHGSTDTKSTNAYRTYKNIVFLGDWNIGAKDLQITCQAYDIKLTGDRWHFYYYIQTICRIGIRNHNKGKYNVFFSDDHDQRLQSSTSLFPHQWDMRYCGY